jgi:restriction system protein
VIATKRDGVSIRIIDQVKALSPGRRVTAEQFRGLLGALSAMPDASKGCITTTGDLHRVFAAHARLIPTRIQLRDRVDLFTWFDQILRQSGDGKAR